MLLGCPCVGYVGPSLVVAYFRQHGNCASPWYDWSPVPVLYKRLAATVEPSHMVAGCGIQC